MDRIKIRVPLRPPEGRWGVMHERATVLVLAADAVLVAVKRPRFCAAPIRVAALG